MVTPIVTPTFNAVAGICAGGALTALPTTSTNGIVGTWSPALDNTITTTYTFTPNAGQCATATSLVVVVTPIVTPTTAFNYATSYCTTDTDPTPSGVGITAGGIYTVTPSGLSINGSTGLIDVSASAVGTYVITYTVIATGCNPASSSSDVVTISTCTTLPYSLGNYVWNDINGNGIQEAGEAPIAGVVVNLIDPITGIITATTTTDPTGFYTFTGLVNGNYTVQFITPSGLVPTASNTTSDGLDSDLLPSGIVNVTINNANDFTIDAGYYVPSSVGYLVWEDIDKDGVPDASEPGIPGVTINLYNNGGVLVGTTTTDITGSWSFEGLPPGNYTVVVTEPSGFSNVSTPVQYPIVLGVGQNLPNFEFGFYNITLAINLVSYQVTATDCGTIDGKFKVASQLTGTVYQVLTSTDGVYFSLAESIEANSNATATYHFTLVNQIGNNIFVKLIALEPNGTQSYFGMKVITNNCTNSDNNISVYPNPIQDVMTVELNSTISGNDYLVVIDVTGRLLIEQSIEMNLGLNTYTLPCGILAQGVYFVGLRSNNHVTYIRIKK